MEMLLTAFLVLLIAALALGNVMLSMLKPVSLRSGESREALNQGTQSGLGNPVSGVFKSDPGLERLAERERIWFLNKRIDRLEALLLKINGSHFLGKKLNSTVLGKKLNDLVEFKDNTRLEIAALKQELMRVKARLGIQEKKSNGYCISDKKLHDLVFKAGSAKG